MCSTATLWPPPPSPTCRSRRSGCLPWWLRRGRGRRRDGDRADRQRRRAGGLSQRSRSQRTCPKWEAVSAATRRGPGRRGYVRRAGGEVGGLEVEKLAAHSVRARDTHRAAPHLGRPESTSTKTERSLRAAPPVAGAARPVVTPPPSVAGARRRSRTSSPMCRPGAGRASGRSGRRRWRQPVWDRGGAEVRRGRRRGR
jgi:hypothetical protein